MKTITNRRFRGASRCVDAAVLLGLAAFLATVSAISLPSGVSATQFNASLRGRVTDVDGNPLAGVKVTIRKLDQDPSRPSDPTELETNEDGSYYSRSVSLGDTMISFEFPGLERVEERRQLRRPGPVRIDVTMKVAEIPEEFVRAQVANDEYGAGVDAFNAGNYADAVVRMNSVLTALDDTAENAESRAQVLALLGAAYSRQRMFDEAVEAFTKRLEYAPDDADARLDLAQALADSGNEAEARQQREAVLEIDSDDAATLYNIGTTMVAAGDVEAGIARMERAVELQPVYPLAYKNLGYAYARTEEYAKAIAVFEKYVEQAPNADDVAQIQDFVQALKEMIGE